MGMHRGFFCLTWLVFVGCATASVPPKTSSKPRPDTEAYYKQIQDNELKKIDRHISKLRRNELSGSRTGAVQQALPTPLTEDTLYAEVITAFRKSNLGALLFYQEQILARYPKSVHSDNALFLSGKLYFRQAQYGKALPYFQRIVDHFPGSNKRAGALLVKAQIYFNLNLQDLALKTLIQLQKEYPGSPEFYQAEGEMRLLQQTTTSG